MSCQDFEFVSIELARGSLVDAAVREAAKSHVAACAPCAARLRRERALSSALREVGASMREREAPARVEAALLTAMRERRAAATADAATVITTAAAAAEAPGSQTATQREIVKASRREVVAISRFAPRARRALYAAAIAASLLVACAVAWRTLSQKTQVERVADGTKSVKQDQGAELAKHDRRAESAKNEQAKNELNDQAKNEQAKDALNEQGNEPTAPGVVERGGASGGMNVARPAARRRARGAVESLPIVFAEDGGRVTPDDGAAAASPVAASAADLAATSDFVPLVAADSATPLDSGQMVRVQVSRAALAALGLPVNASRAGETVRADVLLAHDGTARAIRLLP
jgi:hypothetical protein